MSTALNDELREKYRVERDKRIRPEGKDQYIKPEGNLSSIVKDHFSETAARNAVTDKN